MRYGISSMPTLLSFDRGEPQLEARITRLGDLKSREFLTKWLQREAARGGRGGAGGNGQKLMGKIFGA